MDLSNELNQIGGRVFTTKVCYADTPQNRKNTRSNIVKGVKQTLLEDRNQLQDERCFFEGECFF